MHANLKSLTEFPKLALKPITATNTSTVCLVCRKEAILNTHCHNCKVFGEAPVAVSAVSIWDAPLSRIT